MPSASPRTASGWRPQRGLRCRFIPGAESDIETLTALRKLLDSEETGRRINAFMQDGTYYPRALTLAVGEAYAEIISRPNNILALEYIKACKKYNIEPTAIRRVGAGHDDVLPVGEVASASAIRTMILGGECCTRYTPMRIGQPVRLSVIEPAVLYRLRTISPQELCGIAGVSEGLENRIMAAAKKYYSLEEILKAVKTKRYTMARLRRILLSAFLDITAEMQRTPVPYLRVLGIRSGKEALLKDTRLPLLVKVRTDAQALSEAEKEIFRADLRATEAMNLASKQIPKNDYSEGIIRI